MKEVFKIKIDLQDVGEFINITSSIINDINLFQGNTVVSGKSLMGIYSLDLSSPINLVIRDIEDDTIVMDNFKKWLI